MVTHPEVVRAVVRECKARGAADIKVGDNPGGIDRNSTFTAQKSGIVEASEGCFYGLAQRLQEVPASSKYVDTFLIPTAILEADYLINVPVFKTSVLSILTGAIKNLYGYVPGGLKGQLHFKAPGRRRFFEMLIDLMAIRPPDLHIIDGLTVMDGNGPRASRVRPLGKILASTDPVALDATVLRMMGVEPSTVHYLPVAEKRGLGTLREEEIEVVGEREPIADFQLPTVGFWATEEAMKLLWQMGTLKPAVFPERCSPCDLCDKYCPTQAIRVVKYPVVDEVKCISCFACAEFCPVGALEAPAGKTDELMLEIFR